MDRLLALLIAALLRGFAAEALASLIEPHARQLAPFLSERACVVVALVIAVIVAEALGLALERALVRRQRRCASGKPQPYLNEDDGA